MEENDFVLCEIFYLNNLSLLTSVIGRITKSQIKEFKENHCMYVWFQESSHPIIPKNRIRKIITYKENKIYVKNKQNEDLYQTTERRFGEIIV